MKISMLFSRPWLAPWHKAKPPAIKKEELDRFLAGRPWLAIRHMAAQRLSMAMGAMLIDDLPDNLRHQARGEATAMRWILEQVERDLARPGSASDADDGAQAAKDERRLRELFEIMKGDTSGNGRS